MTAGRIDLTGIDLVAIKSKLPPNLVANLPASAGRCKDKIASAFNSAI